MVAMLITGEEFPKLPQAVQKSLMDHFYGHGGVDNLPARPRRGRVAAAALAIEPETRRGDSKLCSVSVSQAAEILRTCSTPTRTALEWIAEQPEETFAVADLVRAMNVKSPGDLTGVWRGITNRTRNVLGSDADVIYRDGSHGTISRRTQQSFRTVFSRQAA